MSSAITDHHGTIGDVAPCEEAPTWETSKENVMPLKKGRSTKGLKVGLGGLAAQSGLSAKTKLDDQKLQFEAEIAADSGELN